MYDAIYSSYSFKLACQKFRSYTSSFWIKQLQYTKITSHCYSKPSTATLSAENTSKLCT